MLQDLRKLLEKEASDIDELQLSRTAELEERGRLADAVLRREPPDAPAYAAAEQAVRAGQAMTEQVARLADARRRAVEEAGRDLSELLGHGGRGGRPFE